MAGDGHRFLRLEVTLQEDLHSGTGTGGGALDALQIRDRHGRPVIRATHVKGLLREAGRELCRLNANAPDEIRRLFGARGARQQGALVLQSLRCVAGADRRVTWTSTARRRDSRVPLDDTLRTVEHVGAGARFAARLALRDPSLEPLLRRCLRRTTHLGSRRSRGAGAITARLDPADERPPHALPGPSPDWRRLRLLLVGLDPLCLPVTGNPGNLIRTECYIRGQQLLGALVRWAIDHGVDAGALLARDRIEVSNALPLPETVDALAADPPLDGWDVCPMPLSVEFGKPRGQTEPAWPWWAETAVPGEEERNRIRPPPAAAEAEEGEDGRRERWQRPPQDTFLFRDGPADGWRPFRPTIAVHLRNRVPRSEDDEGQLFATEEIAEDTLFLADLLFRDTAAAEACADAFAPVLQGRAWLTVGRGGRPVEVARPVCWLPLGTEPASSGADGFTLTLESDLVARAPDLGYYQTLDPIILAELAGLSEADRRDASRATWDPPATDVVEVHGFNAASGLPRLPVLAIRRGSVIRVTGPASGRLRAALAARSALGERTWEGFGRFRLDLVPTLSVSPRPAPEPDAAVSAAEALAAAAFDLAARLDELKRRTTPWPSKSQWNDLGVQAVSAPDKRALLALLTGLTRDGGRLGGAGWMSVPLDDIRRAVEHYDGERASAFLDLLVRRHVLTFEAEP